METTFGLLFFFFGFFILIKGANWLVSGARSIARVFEISPWFVGLVIVGIGTSVPELSINIASVFNGNTIGLATIIGSNTFNILVILGISAFVTPIALKKIWIRRDMLLNITAIAIAFFVILISTLGADDWIGVTRFEGVLLFALFIAWMWYMFRQRDYTYTENEIQGEVFSGFVSFIFIVAGIAGVFLGGHWVVNGAEMLATLVGVSPTLIALTIVAAGTSLPELTVSLVALVRKENGIAIGNILGSNIFDFLGIIGITAILRPIPVAETVRFDMLAALVAAGLLFSLAISGKRYFLSRKEGILMLITYAVYLTLIIWRG